MPTRRAPLKRGERIAIALFLLWAAICGCTSAEVKPELPIASIQGEPGESGDHLVARILVDACTRRETSEPLIQLVIEAKAICGEWGPACASQICAWLHKGEGCAAFVRYPLSASNWPSYERPKLLTLPVRRHTRRTS